MARLKVGIIGCGGIANGKHMPALKAIDRVDIVAFCDLIEEKAVKAAKEYGVEELVLGHPINMDGTRGPRSEKAQAMKVLLEETTSLPVTLWDERRTTIDAHQILMNNGKNAKKRKQTVDAVAASLILEGYLTYRKNHG